MLKSLKKQEICSKILQKNTFLSLHQNTDRLFNSQKNELFSLKTRSTQTIGEIYNTSLRLTEERIENRLHILKQNKATRSLRSSIFLNKLHYHVFSDNDHEWRTRLQRTLHPLPTTQNTGTCSTGPETSCKPVLFIKVLSGELGPEGRQFDAVVTYSSLEHGGLGRYGDQLNPWADLIAMAKAWCLTKTGGRLLIGVPTGPDTVRNYPTTGVNFMNDLMLKKMPKT